MDTKAKKVKTRSSLDPDVEFPKKDVSDWKYSGHLPSYGDVIGGIRHMVDRNTSKEESVKFVSETLIKHWSDRNVYPQHVIKVSKTLGDDYKEFVSVRKLIIRSDRPPTQQSISRYEVLRDRRDLLYDIFGDLENESKHNKKQMKERIHQLESASGVTMSANEYAFLESQRNAEIPRHLKLQCIPSQENINPVWANKQQDRLQKRLAYEETVREETESCTISTWDDDCSAYDTDESDMSTETETTFEPTTSTTTTSASSKRKRRQYLPCDPNMDDGLPEEMRYVRNSERDVREEIYLAATDLIGIGLSPREALKAIEIVSNRCFGRQFHQLPDDMGKSEAKTLEPIDQNTLPDERSVRDMAERVEAQGLAAEAKEVMARSKEGDIITHAGDSTTKRHVGKFYVSGLHVNKEEPLPLPTVPVAGEAREEIAQQAALGIQILAAAMDPPVDPAAIYDSIDLHLTDSVSHNKFLSEDVPKLFVFCSTHTGLGFCSSMNSSISQIEQNLGVQNILEGFCVSIEQESKNGSLVGQFVDCMTRLVGLEMKHKPWNRGEQFKKYCVDEGCLYTMFLYKDERFGCFPKACAVCIYSREILQEFLMSHPDIDNRLACLVRDIYGQEYVKLCMAVVGVFGIQLIEPFHAKTISKDSNHDTLKIFFQNLHDKMGETITSEFLNLDSPWYPGITP